MTASLGPSPRTQGTLLRFPVLSAGYGGRREVVRLSAEKATLEAMQGGQGEAKDEIARLMAMVEMEAARAEGALGREAEALAKAAREKEEQRRLAEELAELQKKVPAPPSARPSMLLLALVSRSRPWARDASDRDHGHDRHSYGHVDELLHSWATALLLISRTWVRSKWE